MQGLMQDRPLTLDHFFNRAEKLFAAKGVVTATAGGLERENYGEWADRSRRLGGVFDDARHLRRRAGGHLRMEHRPPPRAVLRRPLQRSGAAHAQHPPVPRPGHLHREPRRGRGHLRRPLPGGAPLAAPRQLRDGAPRRRDGRRQGRGARRRRSRRAARLRGAPRCGRADRLAPPRREPCRVDVLHERHHGQPEGRRLLSPLDLVAHDGGDDRRRSRGQRVRHHPAGRADVPCQRVGSRPCRRGRRRQPRDARARPVPAGHRSAHRGGEGHRGGRRAHHLDGRAARAQGSRHVAPAHRPLRRFGGAQGAVGGLPRADGSSHHPGVGHDRDEPRRIGGAHEELPGRVAGRGGAGRRAHDDRARRRSASTSASSIRPRASRCRGTAPRAASSR